MKTNSFYFLLILLFLFPLNQLISQTSPGDVWMVPGTYTAGINTTFTTEIHVNTGNQAVSALGLTINFDYTIIYYRSAAGLIAEPPLDEFYEITIAPENPGSIKISGFTTTGMGPDEDILLLTITWEAMAQGSSSVQLMVDTLVDASYESIGTPSGIDGTIIVSDELLGDVDNNGEVNIIDALLIAQYYVGLLDPPFPESAADVDRNGIVNIIDALMVAQYYVGIITSF